MKQITTTFRIGDTAGGVMTAVNTAAGTVSGLAGNQGDRVKNYDANGSAGRKGTQSAQANNSFYANIGVNAGAVIGYGHKMQTTGNGGSVSLGRSSQNTVETVYHNGSFANVNEVHNNTGTMTVSGFNQEGGKVTGNISNLIAESRQNTSTTTGRSSGMNIGVSSQGIPNSVGINGSRTSGSRAYVDNQTTFIAGEGSNLTVGKANNTGAVISTIENGTIDIQSYTGKDIQNYDTMKTAGGSVGFTTGNVPVSSIGFNQETGDKEGTARNTVTGNVTAKETAGDTVNRDISRANETTRDTYSRTNINVESQTIQYAANPDKLKEDLNKAGQEIRDAARAFNESVNDRGDDNRNFLGQLREIRLNETIENIAGEKWKNASTSLEVSEAYRMALKDLGYDNVQIIFSDPENSPQLIDENGRPKAGTAFVRKDGARTIIINAESEENQTKAGLIGTISEEGSHIVGKLEGRQIETGTDEKGLESTGRATNKYLKDKYRDDKTTIEISSDGKDYSGVDFGENVGDRKNEGWNIYQKDLRNEGYTEQDIQNNLYWWFGKDEKRIPEYSIDVDWKKYKANKKYREMINYYYYQAKKSLRIKDIKKDGDNGIIVSDGEKNYYLTKVSDNEAIYHNMYYDEKEKKIYFYLDGRNTKYVSEFGYEVILDKDGKVVYNPLNIGTYNFYTYKSKYSADAIGHGRDFTLWVLYGTGPDDSTNKNPKIRKKIGETLFAIHFQQNYENIKKRFTKSKIFI